MHGIELSLLIQKILDFVEARMVIVASNLSAVVGTAFAAKLMITPGSPTELANMTSCDGQLLGSKKMFLAGFSRLLTDIVGLSSKQVYFRPHPHLCKLVLVATRGFYQGRSIGEHWNMSSSGGFEENSKVAKASSCEASYTTSHPF
jgi:hypothetical protein